MSITVTYFSKAVTIDKASLKLPLCNNNDANYCINHRYISQVHYNLKELEV